MPGGGSSSGKLVKNAFHTSILISSNVTMGTLVFRLYAGELV